MPRKMIIDSDAKANPALRHQVSSLRGCMLDAAERVEVPSRFQFVPSKDAPSMILTDLETGRTTLVSLCDYRGVREALNELFGD